ncbi:hypothetical protein D3C77_649950 [compost metagenome]
MCHWKFACTAAPWCARPTCDCCGVSWNQRALRSLSIVFDVFRDILAVFVAVSIAIRTKFSAHWIGVGFAKPSVVIDVCIFMGG